MRVQSFILLVSLLFLHTYALAQKENFIQKQEIIKLTSLIDRGNSGQASILLDKLIKNELSATEEIQVKILTAKSLHENGKRVEAIQQLQDLLASSAIKSQQNINLRTEAYLQLAECYFGMYWEEKFKNISDTVLQLTSQYHLPACYKARALTNIARYYNYHTLGNAKPYLDTAILLFKTAPKAERKYYHPLAILAAKINFSRNFDNINLISVIDSAKAILSLGYPDEKYDQIYLWRAIGNAYFDKARVKDKRINWHWYPAVAFSFNKATAILERNYPTNQIDLVYLNNLFGLLDFYSGYFGLAQKKFDASIKILSDNHVSAENFSFAYLNTYLWEFKNIDTLYRGAKLFEQKKIQLSRWQSLAPYWEKWEDNNQKRELHYYRDIYSVDPFSMIVSLCYDLYQHEKDTRYINIALQAQEKSKCYFLKKQMIEKYALHDLTEPTIQKIQQRLLTNEAVISYSDVMSYLRGSYAVVITRDTAAILFIDNDRTFYGRGDVKLSDSICRYFYSFKTKCYEGYNVYIKPVKQLFNKKVDHLLILPSTFSSYFNFEMMISDTLGFRSFASLPYLMKQYHINFEFSWQVAELRKQIKNYNQNNETNWQAYVPDYSHTEFYQLPFFTRSSAVLMNKFGFTAFNNKNATLSNYEANAGSANILHVAGHCYSTDRSAEDLYIAVDSAKTGESNYLNAEKIIHTPLSADLTVLSLCETGLGESYVSGSYLNMAYWFTYAGSKSCLYSYWKIDDRSTAYILERFYHYLAEGLKKSDALRNAKQDYLAQATTDEEKNPIYWGGLSLIGDDSPVNIIEHTGWSYWYFIILVIIIPVFIFLFTRRKKSNKSNLGKIIIIKSKIQL